MPLLAGCHASQESKATSNNTPSAKEQIMSVEEIVEEKNEPEEPLPETKDYIVEDLKFSVPES